MVTQKQKWRKICSMCCLLQYTLYGKTTKGKTSDKRKTNHKTKNCTSCQSFCYACCLPASLPAVRLRLPSTAAFRSHSLAPYRTPSAPFHLRFPSAAPLYCFDLMLCENIDLSSAKVSWRLQIISKTLYNLQVYIDADYKKKTFYACASIVRLQVLICYVNTFLQRIIDRF